MVIYYSMYAYYSRKRINKPLAGETALFQLKTGIYLRQTITTSVLKATLVKIMI